MSIRFTPSSTTRRRTALALSGSSGGPQMPVPGDAHGAVAEPADLEIAADREGRSHAEEITQRSQEARAPGIAWRPMTITEAPLHGKLTAPTRRDFIRGIAAAGAGTAGAVAAAERGPAPVRRSGAGPRKQPLRRLLRDRVVQRRQLPGPRRLPRGRADLVGGHLPRRRSPRAAIRVQQRLPRLLPAQRQPRGTAVRQPRVPRPVLPARLQAQRRRQDAGAGAGGAGLGRQLDPARQEAPRRQLEGGLPIGVQPPHLR